MKMLHCIPLVVFIISCGQSATERQEQVVKTPAIVEVIEIAADSASKGIDIGFDKVIAAAKSKEIPHIENANFDSFIDEDDFDEIDASALKLGLVYPEYNRANHLFRAIAYYQIPLSNNFHTLVITLLKGEHEMKTVLINYDREGNPIAHEEIGYDEIAEGMSRTVSRISEKSLTMHQIFWSNTKEVEETEYEILSDGTIEKVDTKRLNNTVNDFTLVNSVLLDLGLDWVQTKTDLIATKEHPNNPNETIVVIPEIVDESEMYFSLNSHIVIADNRTGKIKHNYFEGPQTNEWVSDAVKLAEIEIDAIPYEVTKDKVAFGLFVWDRINFNFS